MKSAVNRTVADGATVPSKSEQPANDNPLKIRILHFVLQNQGQI